MAEIRGNDTKPELHLRKGLHALGFRYCLYKRDLSGRPDLVFPKYGAAVFVHGCFWHRHPGCRLTTTPSTRTDFWLKKFQSNIERDQRNLNALSETGWRTAVVWECALRGDKVPSTVEAVSAWLMGDDCELDVGA